MGLCASSKYSTAAVTTTLSPEEVNVRKENVVKWRRNIKRSVVNKSLLDCGRLKNDVFCSIVEEPWKMKGDTYVMDVFDFFKKRRGEINVAFKGGEYVEHSLKYDYSRTVVLALISRNSSKVVSAILCVEHDTRGGKVWEVIWFATRQRKQNKGFGACLFSVSQKVAKKCGVKGILVTATNEVVTWWIGTNSSAAKIGVRQKSF